MLKENSEGVSQPGEARPDGSMHEHIFNLARVLYPLYLELLICMCACMRLFVRLAACLPDLHACTYACMHVNVCTYVWAHARLSVYSSSDFLSFCLPACLNVCACMHVSVIS